MNAKTARQIIEMKSQTFGVEIEMNNIMRSKAAEIAAAFFGTGRYADTHYSNGYCTWSAWDGQGREWKFSKDVSISGPDAEKCELVTPILTYTDLATLQELVRQLRHAGAKSNASRGCGVHIHIGAQDHNEKTLRNLANIMASHEKLLKDALMLDRGRVLRYCRLVEPEFVNRINSRKPKNMAELADAWYEENGGNYGRNDHYNNSRYHMLNLHATFTKGTVEFRLFQFDNPGTTRDGKRYYGGLHAGQLKSYIQLCLALSQMAKDVKSASPKEVQRVNPKFAMRTWLNRLGMIGDEFATARDILTRNLEGDAAFRFGRPAA